MDKKESPFSCPPKILALFQKRIEGDDALLELARERFRRAGLGTEFYAESPDELNRLLGFSPGPDSLTTVHLPRGLDLCEENSRQFILSFARRFGERVFGLILHDQEAARNRFEAYLGALKQMGAGLRRIGPSPFLFIEYAAGLRPDLFVRLFEEARGLEKISACLDTGHIGLRQARETYARRHPGEDVCQLQPSDSALPGLINDVQEAAASALETLLEVIRKIASLGKHLHFHLHDGHPLSTFSEFGVSDHLSFLADIPIPFKYRGSKTLRPMYGPEGLLKIVNESLSRLSEDRVSFSLEIHPAEGRYALGEDAHFFDHWQVKDNAERMSYWLRVLEQNQKLVLDACERSLHQKQS